MARSSGVYSKPPGTTAVTGQPISSAKFNELIDDLVADANLDRPVTAGGTGASDATAARENLLAATKRGIIQKTANYTAVASDDGTWFRMAAALTLSLTAAATLGNRWECLVQAAAGDVVIDPNGSETINGVASLTIASGDAAFIICNGVGFFATVVQGGISSSDVTGALGYTPVTNARTVSASGLATGGGDLTANRTITVPIASQAQAEAGTDNTVAMTPLRTQQNYLANIYTGSNVNETNFPIGHVIAVNNANPSRNGAFTAYLASGSEAYVASGTTALAGTYRGRGIVTAGNCIAVRTA